MKTGIYKITNNITNEVYIGQSKNIEQRWNQYYNKNCKLQRKLYDSFFNYGILNHNFDIIELCSEIELDNKERYWQIHFNVKLNGLNCVIKGGDEIEKKHIDKDYIINENIILIKQNYKVVEFNYNSGKIENRIIFNSEYTTKEKRQIVAKVVGGFRTENKLTELKQIIDDWDYDKFGKISQSKIYKNFKISKNFVEKHYSKFKK